MSQQSEYIKTLVAAGALLAGVNPVVLAQNEMRKLEEIVVTGERTGARSLQEVPIAISAIDGEDITALGIQDFGDLGYVAPNVSALPQPGDTAAPAYGIRGITSGSGEFGVDSGIGLYLDGIYIGRAPGSARKKWRPLKSVYKGEFFDNRIRMNMAAFYSDYTDLQVPRFISGALLIDNAGAAEITGFELEMDAALTDNLTLKATYGYQEFDIKELFLAPGFDAADFGARRANTPESNGSLGLSYMTDTDWGLLSARLDAAWRDEVVYTTLPPATAERDKALTSDALWLLNARVSLSEVQISDWGAMEIAVWGRNLTDEDDKTWGIDFGSFTNAQFMDPRTYGIDLTLRL